MGLREEVARLPKGLNPMRKAWVRAACVGALLGIGGAGTESKAQPSRPTNGGAGTEIKASAAHRPPVVEAVSKTCAGIVSVKVEKRGNRGRKESAGTGVVVDERGYVATNPGSRQ